MSSAKKPAIIIVHAAWHTLLVYYPLLNALIEVGYDPYIPHLRSCNTPASPSIGLKEDAAVIRAELQALRSNDPTRKIVLLMHAYGGVVGSEALNPAFGEQELPGGLDDIYLVYVAGFMLHRGVSSTAAYMDPMYPVALQPEGATTIPKDPGSLFFNGLPEDVRQQEAKKIVKHNGKALKDEATFEAWRAVGIGKWDGEHGKEAPEDEQRLRVWYVVLEDDNALPASIQRGFVEAVRREGVLVRATSFKFGHSPFRDERATRALIEVLKEVEEEM